MGSVYEEGVFLVHWNRLRAVQLLQPSSNRNTCFSVPVHCIIYLEGEGIVREEEFGAED